MLREEKGGGGGEGELVEGLVMQIVGRRGNEVGKGKVR